MWPVPGMVLLGFVPLLDLTTSLPSLSANALLPWHFSEGFPLPVGSQDAAHLHHHLGPALELLIVRLRTICLCGLPTLEDRGVSVVFPPGLTLDEPCVVSFSSAFNLSSWTL